MYVIKVKELDCVVAYVCNPLSCERQTQNRPPPFVAELYSCCAFGQYKLGPGYSLRFRTRSLTRVLLMISSVSRESGVRYMHHVALCGEVKEKHR